MVHNPEDTRMHAGPCMLIRGSFFPTPLISFHGMKFIHAEYSKAIGAKAIKSVTSISFCLSQKHPYEGAP